MNKAIFINNSVHDLYTSGMSLNNAINAVFGEDIKKMKEENPSLEKLDAIQMAMAAADVKKTDTVGKFMDAYTSGGMSENEWLFPAWMETTIREAMYAQSVLPYLVSNTITVDSNIVRSATLDLMTDSNKKAIKRARIAEGADIPVGKITIGEQAINLWKHGRGIEMTYEAMRRMRIDLFRIHMNAIASDLAQQNVEAAADVLINGDGNKNPATKIGTTATNDVITATELVDFLIDYLLATNVVPDTLTMNYKMLKQVSHMSFDTSLATGASNRVGFNMPQLNLQNVTLIGADVPQIGGKDVILVSSRENTLVRYQENGSNIQENQRFIRNQTELMTFTENSGYAVGVAGTNRYIEVKGE